MDLSEKQAEVLQLVAEHEDDEVGLIGLAEEADHSHAALGRILGELEAEGLVEPGSGGPVTTDAADTVLN
jgi:predicted transcriptional regulator